MNRKNMAFFQKIDRIYPDGHVNGLKNKSENLYEEAKAIAKSEGTTVKEFFVKNGYIFTRNNIKKVYSEDRKSLKALYPNGIVKNLHKKDIKLYYKLLNHAKTEFMTLQEYIESLGFKYVLFNSDKLSKEVSSRLKKLYPNKKVVKLSIKDHKLYSKLYKLARKNGQDINTYINELGYKVI